MLLFGGVSAARSFGRHLQTAGPNGALDGGPTPGRRAWLPGILIAISRNSIVGR